MKKIILILLFLYCKFTQGSYLHAYNTTIVNTTWIQSGPYPGNQVYPYPGKPYPYPHPGNSVYYPPRYNNSWGNPGWNPPEYVPRVVDGRHNSSHNLLIGTVGYGDILLFSESFQKDGRWYKSREKIIKYPNKWTRNQRIITAIYCWDKYVNGQGGFATILEGGVGYKNVTIQLRSKGSSQGFLFKVEIYGK